MPPYNILYWILFWLSFSSCNGLTWDQTCPPDCSCKIYDNKKVAECEGASFSTIPSKLSSEFQVLDLTKNNLRALYKDAFKKVNLVNLNRLILTNNRIADINPGAFNDLRLLMDLDLSNNLIKKLHPETFSGMEKMRKLILSGNAIQRLEAYQFPLLPNLQHLLIDNCKLDYVNNLAFANLHKLTSINLQSNELTTIQRELFTSRTELKSVMLNGNKWNCDCRLRGIVDWIQKETKAESQLSCYTPERVANKRWLDLDTNDDLACPPVVFVPQDKVYITAGSNATLSCGASGEPFPSIEWIKDGIVIRESSRRLPNDPHVKYYVTGGDLLHGVLWSNLTVEYTTMDSMNYEPTEIYKCKVDNPAQLKEYNVTLVFLKEFPLFDEPVDEVNIYLIVAIVSVLILVILLIIVMIVFCTKRRRTHSSKIPLNERALAERNNILIVNPVEKPPRKNDIYEKLPQVEVELTDLSKGTHKNFEEMNYPEERIGRVRAPLTALEEEEFEQSSQKLLDVSANTSTTVDYPPQYPDLLDNVHFPRAISPADLSYHSLTNPLFTPSPEWRYSYVYPTEKYSTLYASPPSVQSQRPGYVTLPRRPKASSLTSSTTPTHSSPLGKVDPVYDTLGPRTTADGMSRTDLTRVSKSAIDTYLSTSGIEPRASPIVVATNGLPPHYTHLPEQSTANSRPMTKTLPRPPKSILDVPEIPRSPFPDGQSSPTSSKISPSPSPSEILSSVPQTSLTSSPAPSNQDVATSKRKVPPKPPPKPSKRLSVASTNSDIASRLSSIGSGYQDEGPDGTEV